jgi:hypothetical protein
MRLSQQNRPLTSFTALHKFGRYRINSGQTAPSDLTGSDAFDPSRKCRVHRSSRDNGELDQQLAEARAQTNPSKSKGKRAA